LIVTISLQTKEPHHRVGDISAGKRDHERDTLAVTPKRRPSSLIASFKSFLSSLSACENWTTASVRETKPDGQRDLFPYFGGIEWGAEPVK
jgi:hypothetical protein